MNIYELVDELGGEIVRGRARYRVGEDWILLAKFEGSEMALTEAGRQQLREKEAALRPTKTRRMSKSDGPVAAD